LPPDQAAPFWRDAQAQAAAAQILGSYRKAAYMTVAMTNKVIETRSVKTAAKTIQS
jgi:hypothetical protein